MPTAALIRRSADLLKHRHDLWKASQAGEAADLSQALRDSDADLELFRLDVAQHHRQEAAALAALNHRLQLRHTSVGNS